MVRLGFYREQLGFDGDGFWFLNWKLIIYDYRVYVLVFLEDVGRFK